MSHFYRYEKRQRRTAMLLVVNMVVLLAMYLAARKFIQPSEAGEQLFYWMNIALPIVELGLLVFAVLFWIQDGTFKIAVDADHFEIADPLSEKASFCVSVKEIVEISQTHEKHVGVSKITMLMKSGERIPILQNYNYSRGKLYAALAKANSNIRLPEHTFRFKQV
ncbi:hypothetical protein [Novipirellula caenicola]|uniref:Uncharacterized protein n=1 Tax=Novipirellula caenicola TaxID=1536901 RepID=A0ABP9VN55_9BACT